MQESVDVICTFPQEGPTLEEVLAALAAGLKTEEPPWAGRG